MGIIIDWMISTTYTHISVMLSSFMYLVAYRSSRREVGPRSFNHLSIEQLPNF